jgi:hypothetical protein
LTFAASKIYPLRLQTIDTIATVDEAHLWVVVGEGEADLFTRARGPPVLLNPEAKQKVDRVTAGPAPIPSVKMRSC